MDRHATLWLSEACSGTRWARECAALVARGGCVIAGYRMGECRFVAAHCAVLQATPACGERQRVSRRARSTRGGSLTLATLAVWCRSWLISSPTWRRWALCVTDSMPPPPGWRITSPLVIVSASAEVRALRCALAAATCFDRDYRVNGANGLFYFCLDSGWCALAAAICYRANGRYYFANELIGAIGGGAWR